MTFHREPPTTDAAGDLSRSRLGTSAAAGGMSPSEERLMRAYLHAAPIEVQQDCACGGVIRATMGDWGAIALAIRCHQELTIHVMWREAHEL